MRVRLVARQRAVGLEPAVAQRAAERRAQDSRTRVDALDVDHRPSAGRDSRCWAGQRPGGEAHGRGRSVEARGERGDQPGRQRAAAARRACAAISAEHQLQRHSCWPASQRMNASASCAISKRQIAVVGAGVELHRRREAAQQRRHRLAAGTRKVKRCVGLAQLQDARRCPWARSRPRAAAAAARRRADQAHADRDMAAAASRAGPASPDVVWLISSVRPERAGS